MSATDDPFCAGMPCGIVHLMNKKVYISGAILIAGILGIYFWNGKSASDGDVAKSLTPETAITHSHGLAIDVADSNNLYIATHHGLLVLKNEKDLYRIGASRDDYMGFTPHTQNPAVFYSSGHPQNGGNLGFQKSEDGGYTWQKVSDGIEGPVDFHAMAMSPDNPNLFYGWYKGALQRSEDGGKIWNIVNDNFLAVQLATDPKDENVVFAATPDGRGVIVSKDKGATWNNLSSELTGGQVSVVAIHPTDTKRMFAFSEKIGGLGKSFDGGTTWKKIDNDFNNETVLYITFDTKNPSTMYLLTHANTIYKSTDTGETWVKIY